MLGFVEMRINWNAVNAVSRVILPVVGAVLLFLQNREIGFLLQVLIVLEWTPLDTKLLHKLGAVFVFNAFEDAVKNRAPEHKENKQIEYAAPLAGPVGTLMVIFSAVAIIDGTALCAARAAGHFRHGLGAVAEDLLGGIFCEGILT